MLVFLDIETTGFDGEKDQLLEIAAIKWDGQKECGRFETLIQLPEKFKIPAMITGLTGITDQMCEEQGNPLEKSIQDLEDFLSPDDIIAGHNISFDIGFLQKKGARLPQKSIDTFLISLLVLGTEETSHSLEMLARKYGIVQENAHRAMSDVEANIELYILMQNTWNRHPNPAFSQFLETYHHKITFPEYQFFTERPTAPFAPQGKPQDIAFSPVSITSESSIPAIENWIHQPDQSLMVEVSSAEGTLDQIINAALKEKKQLCIAYPLDDTEGGIETWEVIKKAYPSHSVGFYGNPFQQIDDAKWKQFLAQDQFDRPETIVLLKIYKAKSDKTEMKLRFLGDEWKAVRKVFSEAEIVPESTEEIVFLPFIQTYHTPHDAKLVVLQAENLETMLEEKEKIKLFEKRLREDMPDFPNEPFEKISSCLRSIKGDNKYALPVYESEFKHLGAVQEGFRMLENLLAANDSWALIPWKQLFAERNAPEYIFCIEIFPDNALAFSLIPKSLQESFDELLACGDGVLFLGKSFPTDATHRLRFTFEVPKNLPFVPWNQTIPPLQMEYSVELMQAELGHGKNVIISTTSKKAADEIVEQFRDFCDANSIFLAAQKGGSTKKIRSLLASASQVLIIGTVSFLDSLRVEELQNVVVAIPKLTFDPPNHPILKYRREQLHNDFEDFALPRAKTRLHKELHRCVHAEKIVLGDPKFAQSWAKKLVE